MDEVNSGLKSSRVPSATIAVASVLAKWFDQIIRARRLIPNNNDEYVFAVLRSEFEKNTMRNNISKELKNALRDYGYKIKLNRSEVVIIKYR